MSAATVPLTYQEIGITRAAPEGPLPAGAHLLRVRTRLGRGEGVLRAAGEALLGFGMQRGVGLRVRATAPVADVGVEVTLLAGLGPLRLGAPCRVVWRIDEPERIGYGYGTLPGHPESGEEGFVVERLADDSVWLTVTAVSRAATWYMRAAGPLGRLGQRVIARRYGRALRRLSARGSQLS
ncbi:DUF1990 family protein [Streptomyces hoynatensis]|uniref:DUF1990 domain-containing protein n=1 Tax=Streptomyces hoynatensis TaxID=1141874 RepID=A0A3A9ZF70_9ACTN|nr:DUF1990 domain-containing protein [Streptomyces hoynatensis]RKN46990.1 DUF1990 domain-containing protein [Streptomyces hoynatensis]